MDEAAIQLTGHQIEPIEMQPGHDAKAEEIRQLLEVDYPQAEKVKLLCDNLNTDNIASLYKAFPARLGTPSRQEIGDLSYTSQWKSAQCRRD